MKLFIDTANLDEISTALEYGLAQGVTTNPSLLAKEPQADFYAHIQRIADVCTELSPDIPLSVEVFAQTPDAMIDQAHHIVGTIKYTNLNIKIPVGFDEMRVVKALSNDGVRVNCTCCFTATQMQLAAAAGARYVSLFYNRALDSQIDALQTLRRTRKFIDTNLLNCEIIAGSIRNAYDLEDCWDAGCDIVTAGMPAIRKSVAHLKTDESVEGFLKDFAAWIE